MDLRSKEKKTRMKKAEQTGTASRPCTPGTSIRLLTVDTTRPMKKPPLRSRKRKLEETANTIAVTKAMGPSDTLVVTKTRPNNMYESTTANLSGKITVKVCGDEFPCSTMYMSMIGDDKLAIADHSNKTITIVDIEHQTVVSTIKLPHLWDIVHVADEEQLAATLPSKHEIQFLSLSYDRLSIVRQMEVDGTCMGLAYYDRNLIVTFAGARGKIQIMTLHGSVLLTVPATPFGEIVFRLPYYIAVDQQNRCMYATDLQNKYDRITRMSLDGDVTGLYQDPTMKHPSGMDVLADGSLLVCSQWTNTILMIASDLTKSRPLLQEKDEVKVPNCLTLDRERHKLYVGNHASDYIHVYDLK